MSGNPETRMLGLQARSQLRRHAFCGAKQKEPEMAAGAERGQGRDEVDAGHRLADRATLASNRPDDTATVGQAQVCRFKDAGELMIHPRPHYELRVDGCNKMVAASLDELPHPFQGGAHIKAIDPHAENTDLVHWRDYHSQVAD